MRLCCLEWGKGGDEIVLMLHDAGGSASTWAPVAAPLAARGFRVLALDLRGHGESTWSSDQRYSADVHADDVAAFITALDLYTRPVALVGVGVGGAVALTLAQRCPALVGAVVVAEFAPTAEPATETGAAAAACLQDQGPDPSKHVGDAELDDGSGNAQVPAWQRRPAGGEQGSTLCAPWWGGYPGQGAEFSDLSQLACLLGHPLSALGPLDAARFATWAACLRGDDPATAQGDAEREAARRGLQRALSTPRAATCAAAAAWAAASLPHGVSHEEVAGSGTGDPLILRADPAWLFSFDTAAVQRRMPAVTAHLLLLVGGGSGWVSSADCEILAVAACNSPAAQVQVVPGMGHWVLPDAAEALTARLLAFLEGPAMAALQKGSAASRRPEVLELKPLPRYADLQTAQKALGPRPLPRPEDVAQALAQLELENGEEPDASDDSRQTALANNPSDYFGMVG